MEQAASQIQDSRDLSLGKEAFLAARLRAVFFLTGMGGLIKWCRPDELIAQLAKMFKD